MCKILFIASQRGCPGCGFSYCSKCLDYKIFVPKLNAEAKVCGKCKRAASNPNETKTVVEPPKAYYRRLGVMYDKQETNKISDSNADPIDQTISERLQKLKEDRDVPMTTDEQIKSRLQNIKGEMPSTSDAEIQERLAKLRGMPVISMTSKPVLLPPDTRTEQEQANDLLKQYMEQTTIDTQYKDEFDNLISDMESRMQKLRGTDSTNSKDQSQGTNTKESAESEDEEEAVKKIVEKIKAESLIEDDIAPSTNDELPFCEICNEDARMRCLGCRYLFCKRCFMEHKDDDDGCNRYEPYQAPRQH
ncbi:abscission/NoCut checkpoint regulator isoform X2 [Anticarsia gemmatalis]|uniref:abscission/NoCut checkpoint regulator isoform X2 n=1 Tax=Anticarsia gemmatalis TaxID=129554 RepID=UPI003F76729D